MSTLKTNKLVHTANGASVFTLPQTDGSAGQVLKTDGSGNLSFQNDAGGGSANTVVDNDGDTKIQVEESTDEDIIRFLTIKIKSINEKPSPLMVNNSDKSKNETTKDENFSTSDNE